MRARVIVMSAAAAVCLAGCTSSSSGPSTSTGTSPTPAPTSQPGTPSDATTAPVATSSVASSTTSRKPSGSPTTSTSTPAVPAARDHLLTAGDVGSGFQATTQVDASIPSLCGGGGRADRGKPYRSTAQIGFLDSSRRLLVAEKVNVYADQVTAAQINSVVLAFDSCGSAAKYNGLKATYSDPRNLSAQVQKLVESSGARDVMTAQAHVTFETLRVGTTLVQLTFTALGGTPPKAVVDAITLKAAQQLT